MLDKSVTVDQESSIALEANPLEAKFSCVGRPRHSLPALGLVAGNIYSCGVDSRKSFLLFFCQLPRRNT
jgi:hypothetical protein